MEDSIRKHSGGNSFPCSLMNTGPLLRESPHINCEEPSPTRIMFRMARMYILPRTSMPSNCLLLIESILSFSTSESLILFFASLIMISIADTRNPAEPMQVSHTNEFISVRVIRAIKVVTNRGVRTTSLYLSLSMATQSFRLLSILPIKSRWIFPSRRGKMSFSTSL